MISDSYISEGVSYPPRGKCNYYSNFVFQDATGGRHPLFVSFIASPTNCQNGIPIIPVQVLSGGDDYYQATLSSTTLLVADAHGTTYTIPYVSGVKAGSFNTYSILPSSIEDTNGNVINIHASPSPITATDTLGRTLLSVSGFGSTSGDTVTVAGLPNPYTVTWGTNSANHTVGYSVVSADQSGCPSVPPLSGPNLVVKQITLPNNQTYVFTYDTSYGLLSKVTYPNGGYVSYTWMMNSLSEFDSIVDAVGTSDGCQVVHDVPAVAQRSVSFDGVHVALQQNFSYVTTGPAGGWQSKTTTVTTTDNVAGLSYTNVYNYSPYLEPQDPNDNSPYQAQIPLEQTVVTKNSAGTIIRTVAKTWFDQYELQSEKTTQEDGATASKTTYTYGPGAQVTSKSDYDFPGGTALIRKTVTNYQAFNTTPIYPSAASIFDRPCQSIVYDSSGTNRVAETDYFYDGSTTSTPCSAATTQTLTGTGSYTSHDETHYGTAASVARGNLTKVVKLCLQAGPNCAGGNPTTTSAYDETGQISSTTDPNGHITQYSYADSYTVLSGGVNVSYTPSGNTNAFLTTITDPLTHTQNFTYDFNNSQVTVSKDQNALTTTYLYNDSLARPTSTTRPDNGTTTAAYNDTALTVTTSKKINASQTVTSVALSDGVGHVKQTQLTSDPQGTVYTDTIYDGLGRVYSVSNPYRTGADPTTSLGTTTYFYDALGRKCLEVPPDGTQPAGGVCPATQPGNDLFTTYSLNTTTVTDQTGKSRKSVADGLGRLTQVFEDPGGLNYETDYQYDALGNLLCAGQKGTNSGTFTNCASIPAGWRARNFTYDSLSRLLTSNNPEVGTITYKYDLDTNCASPNSFVGLLISKTDARGIRTCAQYDAINREAVFNYSNSDPTVTTTYDQTACLGLSACQNIGHRSSMTDAAGSEAWSYQVDAANNRSVHVEQRTTNSITKTSTYYLDQAGNVTQAVYPTGRVVNYTYDAANRPSTAIDGFNGITYATDFQTAPTGCLTGKVCYTPQGAFYALSIGQTSSFTGLNLTHSYNSRLQPNEFKASSTGGNAIDITYGFVDPVTSHNAGHVYSITNNLNSSRTQNFTYDQLNRIKTAGTSATTGQYCWGYDYSSSYDAWGNLQSQPGAAGYTGCSEYLPPAMTADGNNHLSGFSYDLSGNTQSDGVNSYTWNAESQLKTAAGVTYAYDGDGRRVSKSSGKLYWYGSGGDILAETDASGNNPIEYIFFGGKRVAMLPAGSTPIYYVEDLLGTSRVITSNTGVVCYDADFYPYGGERSYTNTCPQNYKFEGKERDTETGNDDFGARYYSNRFGRWLSADWSSVPVPVPYANLTNPQTLNLYAMVADDPESFADLDGHQKSACDNRGDANSCDPQRHADDQPAQQPTQTSQQAQQTPYQKAVDQENKPLSEADKANALKQAGQMGDAGVKAGLVVVGAEAAAAGVVVAAPTVAAVGSQAATAISTATTSAYVQATTVLSTAGTAIQNGYQTAVNLAKQAVVTVDTLKSGGGAINAARDIVQAATSNRTPPAPNNFGAAGLAIKVAIKLLFP